jgi:hypothetical protein
MYAYKVRRDEDYVLPQPALLRSIDGTDRAFVPVESAARELQNLLARRMLGTVTVTSPAPNAGLSVRSRLAIILAVSGLLWVPLAIAVVALIG